MFLSSGLGKRKGKLTRSMIHLCHAPTPPADPVVFALQVDDGPLRTPFVDRACVDFRDPGGWDGSLSGWDTEVSFLCSIVTGAELIKESFWYSPATLAGVAGLIGVSSTSWIISRAWVSMRFGSRESPALSSCRTTMVLGDTDYGVISLCFAVKCRPTSSKSHSLAVLKKSEMDPADTPWCR